MYATKTDMLERYEETNLIELTDRSEPYTGAIVDSVMDQALDDASVMIDTYIGKRYDLPVAETPKALTLTACTIAYYKLHQGRHTDQLRQEYEDAISFLNKLSNGKVVLDVGGTEPTSSPADARVDGYKKVFSKDSLEGF